MGSARGAGKVSRRDREGIRSRLLQLQRDWGIETVEKLADELGVGRVTVFGWLRKGGENNLPDSASLLGMASPKSLIGRKGKPVSPTWLLTGIGQPYLDAERPVSRDLAGNLGAFLVDRMVGEGLGSRLEVGRWLPAGEESLDVLLRLARERCAVGKTMDRLAKAAGRRPPGLRNVLPPSSTLSGAAMIGWSELVEALEANPAEGVAGIGASVPRISSAKVRGQGRSP